MSAVEGGEVWAVTEEAMSFSQHLEEELVLVQADWHRAVVDLQVEETTSSGEEYCGTCVGRLGAG